MSATVMGGTSLSGGEGSITGTIVGALIISLVRNAMNLYNIESYWQEVIIGTVIVLAVVFFVTIVLAAWLLGIVTAFIRWFRFTLARNGDDLEISTGLFTIRNYTLPRDKIQALQCETTAIRRPFGWFRIRVRSAGHVGVQDQGRGDSDLLMPFTHRDRLGFFAATVWEDAAWDRVAWQGVHPFTRLRQFRILVFLLVIALTLLYTLAEGAFRDPVVLSVLAVVGLLGCWGVAHMTWRQTAFGHDASFVYIKTGFLGLHFWVIPTSRIQNVALTQSPFQRVRGLVSLTVDTAGSGGRDATIPNIHHRIGRDLFDRFTGRRTLTPGTETPPSGDRHPDRDASEPPL